MIKDKFGQDPITLLDEIEQAAIPVTTPTLERWIAALEGEYQTHTHIYAQMDFPPLEFNSPTTIPQPSVPEIQVVARKQAPLSSTAEILNRIKEAGKRSSHKVKQKPQTYLQ